MTNWDLFILAIVIASNNFTVALALGTMGQWRRVIRIMVVFGCFEFFIPLFGAFAGQYFAQYVEDYASTIGGLLLIGLSIYAFYGSFISQPDDQEEWARRTSTWLGLTGLAFGLSIDNMIVGLSLGFTKHSPWLVAAVIACSSVVFTFFGLRFGKFLETYFVKYAQVSGSILLFLLGVATLLGWI
jgi:putative Mn2+ efflux pump MntP